MSKLMDELMAEAQRVNALEVEVERTIDRQKEQIEQERKDRLQSICVFLDKMRDAMIEADAMKMPNNGPTYVLLYGVHYNSDGYNRIAGITFYTDNIFSGGYYSGAGDCSRQETFEGAKIYGARRESMKAIVDAWSPKLEDQIEKAIADYVKVVLAKRMEKMKAELQKSNDEYANYFRKDGE